MRLNLRRENQKRKKKRKKKRENNNRKKDATAGVWPLTDNEGDVAALARQVHVLDCIAEEELVDEGDDFF